MIWQARCRVHDGEVKAFLDRQMKWGEWHDRLATEDGASACSGGVWVYVTYDEEEEEE